MEGKEKGRKEAVEANVVHSGLLKKIITGTKKGKQWDTIRKRD